MSNKIKIFFSYSSEDKEYLKLLKTLIKSIDNNNIIECFDYVERDENSKSSNYKNIFDQITECDIFISILTTNYLKSTLCCWEVGIAYRDKLLESRKDNFWKIAMLRKGDESLELFHLFPNHYYFDRNDLTKLVKDIGDKYPNLELSRFRISNDLSNLKKETESILIKKIIGQNRFSELESEKIKKLIE